MPPSADELKNVEQGFVKILQMGIGIYVMIAGICLLITRYNCSTGLKPSWAQKQAKSFVWIAFWVILALSLIGLLYLILEYLEYETIIVAALADET